MGSGRFYCQSYRARVEVLRMLSYPSARLALKGDLGILSSTERGFTQRQTHAHNVYYEIPHNWFPGSWAGRNMQWKRWKGGILAQTHFRAQAVLFIFRLGFINNQTIPLSEEKRGGRRNHPDLKCWFIFFPLPRFVPSLCVSPTDALRASWPFATNLAPCSPSSSHTSSQRLLRLYGNTIQLCRVFK